MSIPLDYETLRILWWGLLGVLLIGRGARTIELAEAGEDA